MSKTLVTVATVLACTMGAAGLAGGVAVERKINPPFSEEQKQELVDNAKEEGYQEGLKINVGYTEEEMQEAQETARQEGYAQGLEAGSQLGAGYNEEDMENARSEGYAQGFEAGQNSGGSNAELQAQNQELSNSLDNINQMIEDSELSFVENVPFLVKEKAESANFIWCFGGGNKIGCLAKSTNQFKEYSTTLNFKKLLSFDSSACWFLTDEGIAKVDKNWINVTVKSFNDPLTFYTFEVITTPGKYSAFEVFKYKSNIDSQLWFIGCKKISTLYNMEEITWLSLSSNNIGSAKSGDITVEESENSVIISFIDENDSPATVMIEQINSKTFNVT